MCLPMVTDLFEYAMRHHRYQVIIFDLQHGFHQIQLHKCLQALLGVSYSEASTAGNACL